MFCCQYFGDGVVHITQDSLLLSLKQDQLITETAPTIV